MARQSTRSPELTARKIQTAGVSLDGLAAGLAAVHDGKLAGLVRRGQKRAKRLERVAEVVERTVESQRSVVVDVVGARPKAPVELTVAVRFEQLAAAIARFRESVADLQMGDVALALLDAGVGLDVSSLGAFVVHLRKRVEGLTYTEIAVLLVDGWPDGDVLSPTYNKRRGEIRESAIARVTETLRRCAHDAGKREGGDG